MWLLISAFENYALAIPPQICTLLSSVVGSNNMADARTLEVGATLAAPTLGGTEMVPYFC